MQGNSCISQTDRLSQKMNSVKNLLYKYQFKITFHFDHLSI